MLVLMVVVIRAFPMREKVKAATEIAGGPGNAAFIKNASCNDTKVLRHRKRINTPPAASKRRKQLRPVCENPSATTERINRKPAAPK